MNRTQGLLLACTLAILTRLVYPAAGGAAAEQSEAADPAVDRMVAGLQQRYAGIRSLSADFVQTYRAPGIEQSESGTLWMKKPGLMRWEYRQPEEKLFVADGRETFLYTPEDRQVLVSRFTAEELQSTPLQFLLGRGRIRDSYEVSVEAESRPKLEGTVVLRLVPRSSDSSYSWIEIECDERSYELRRLTVREPSGNTSEFLLTNVSTNIRVDDRRFRFSIPEGVEVIRLDEKQGYSR